MKFKDIIIKLKEGDRVRRNCWNRKDYIFLDGKEIKNNQGKKVRFCNINSFLAEDWESRLNFCTKCGRFFNS